MKKIYISGKITGLSIEYATDLFRMAQEYLESEYGCKVINPITEVPYEKGKTWEQYMLEDIRLLFDCDAIFMLENWADSKGARVECSIAKELDKNIIFQSSVDYEI